MPTPHHLRHPAPHPPHRHTTRAPSPLPPQHTLSARHALPARHTRPLHTHPTTPYLLPSILYLYICTSPRPPTAHCDPILSSPPPPFRTASTPLPHALTPSSASRSYLSILLPTPFPCTLPPSSAEKFALPRLKQAVTHLWKSFIPKEEEDLSSTSYPDDIVWITL